MAIGTYATIRPATVLPKDVELFYSFAPDRTSKPSNFIPLSANDLLTAKLEPSLGTTTSEVMGGMYDLRLPAEIFSKKGIYNLYLRPRKIKARILDCGVLAALPAIKGLVLDTTFFSTDTDKLTAGGLVGYRVEYLNSDGSVAPNKFTIVTWSNRCEAIAQNSGNTNQRSIAYKFNDSANLLYLTVTPSTAPAVKANVQPYIGKADQEIVLTNPYFDAAHIEIELTEYDVETLATAIFGEQTRSVEDGVQSWYVTIDGERKILRQSVLYEIKDEFDATLFEIKENLPALDTSKEWRTVTENVINNS